MSRPEPCPLGQGGGGLRARIAESVGWTTTQTVVGIGVQILTVIVLSHLLTPSEVGIVAASLGAVNVLLIVAQLGAGPAIIQRAELDSTHIGAAVILNLIAGGTIFVGLLALAPWLSSLTGIKEMAAVLPVLSIMVFLRPLGLLFDALAKRDLQFRALAVVGLTSSVFGYSAVSIGCALAGFGYWSLVVGTIAQASVLLIILGAWYRHRLTFRLSRQSLRDILGYGIPFTVARGAQEVTINLDRTLVGTFLGADAAGLYARCRQLLHMATTALIQPIESVLFPAMSQVQRDVKKLARGYYSILSLVSLLSLPMALVILVVSDPLVPIVLGSHWSGITEPMRILSFSVFLLAFDGAAAVLARSVGRVRERAVIQVVLAVFVLSAVAVLYRWGIEGICVGILAALLINAVAMAGLTAKALGVPLWRTLVPVLPGAVVTLGLGAAYWACFRILEPSGIIEALLAFGFVVVVGLVLGGVLLFTPRLVLTPDLLEIRARLFARYSKAGSADI